MELKKLRFQQTLGWYSCCWTRDHTFKNHHTQQIPGKYKFPGTGELRAKPSPGDGRWGTAGRHQEQRGGGRGGGPWGAGSCPTPARLCWTEERSSLCVYTAVTTQRSQVLGWKQKRREKKKSPLYKLIINHLWESFLP